MDTQQIATAKACLKAAYDGSMVFPRIVGTLMESGFEGYVVDYRRHTTYFLPDGDSLVLENCSSEPEVVASQFDPVGLAAQVKWAQENPPEYSYLAFSRNVVAFGCAGYVVSFLGRRVLYIGRTAEAHVEHFPR